MSYEPGTYVKGDQARTCDTAADAVQAVYDGFKLQADPSDLDYRELQAKAKELGVPANQSADALAEAVFSNEGGSDSDES